MRIILVENIDDVAQETAKEGISVFDRLFLFFVLGFSLIFAGIIIVLVATLLYGGDSASFGAFVFIGPFPIVFGVGSDPGLVIVAGLFLAVLSIVVFWVMNRKVRSYSD